MDWTKGLKQQNRDKAMDLIQENRKYKIGILGCGKIAQVRHIPEYAANPRAQLYGYYSPTESRAEEMAAKYGGKVYQSAEALLADPELDVISVCSVNSTHAEYTIAALNAGKHVLCEKPMATCMEECLAMVDAARRSGRFLMLDMDQRMAPAHRKAKELLDRGAIGRVISFRTAYAHEGPETWSIAPGRGTWFFDKDRAGFGVLGDLGIHKIDLIQFLLGQRIVSVSAKLATLDKTDPDGFPIRVEDNAFCIFEMSDGAVGTMTASWTCYGPEDNSTVLCGSRGIMRIYEDPKHPLLIQYADGSAEYFDCGAIQTNDNMTPSGIIDLWLDCIRTGTEPFISGYDALSASRVLFAAQKSSETGRPVAIPENRVPFV